MAVGKKTGGRKKGTPNKGTAQYREKVSILFQSTLDVIEQKRDIEMLTPNQRVKLLIDLLSFICPKPQEEGTTDATLAKAMSEFITKSMGG